MSQRQAYEKELKELRDQVILMAAKTEDAIQNSLVALVQKDRELAEEVIRRDDELDELCQSIEHRCVMLVARQQPVAGDLRDITANMKLVTDLERIGDHGEDICVHLKRIWKNPDIEIPPTVMTLGNNTRAMLSAAVDAYIAGRPELAKAVLYMDSEIDRLYIEIKDHLIQKIQEKPEDAPALVELLFICKHLERAADHAQNVAEWILYHLQGVIVEEEKSQENPVDSEDPSIAEV